MYEVFPCDDDPFITRQTFGDFYAIAAKGPDLDIHSTGFPLSDDIDILCIFQPADGINGNLQRLAMSSHHHVDPGEHSAF